MDWETAKAGIRKRPGMYIGDTDDGSGLQHMVIEVLSNAIDQYLAGGCRRIDVRLDADGTFTIEDDGPGMAEPVARATTLHTTATADGHRPHVHLGLIGVGLAAVNALAEHFEIAAVRAGKLTTAIFARGDLVAITGPHSTDRPSGTRVSVRADRAIFGAAPPSRRLLARRLDELTFLTPGLVLSWSLAGDAEAAPDLRTLVALDASCRREDVAHHRGRYDAAGQPVDVEVALTWKGRSQPRIHGFVNLDESRDGGIHVAHLVRAATALYGRTGLVAAVSLICADVLFGNPARTKLVGPDVGPAVAAATRTALDGWAAANLERAGALRRAHLDRKRREAKR